MGILKKVSVAYRNRTTYRIGLLQAKAYRALKQKTADILKPYNVSTFEWAFLGLLADLGTVRHSTMADELGVEAPFVTQMVHGLKSKGFVIESKDRTDSRAKTLALTQKGKLFVQKTEPIVRSGVRPLLRGIGLSDMLGYLSVLSTISKNSDL